MLGKGRSAVWGKLLMLLSILAFAACEPGSITSTDALVTINGETAASVTYPTLDEAAWTGGDGGQLLFQDTLGRVHRWVRHGPETQPHTVVMYVDGVLDGEMRFTYGSQPSIEVDMEGDPDFATEVGDSVFHTWPEDIEDGCDPELDFGCDCETETFAELNDGSCDGDGGANFTFVGAESSLFQGTCEEETEEAREAFLEYTELAKTGLAASGASWTMVVVGAFTAQPILTAMGAAGMVGSAIFIHIGRAKWQAQLKDAEQTCATEAT